MIGVHRKYLTQNFCSVLFWFFSVIRHPTITPLHFPYQCFTLEVPFYSYCDFILFPCFSLLFLVFGNFQKPRYRPPPTSLTLTPKEQCTLTSRSVKWSDNVTFHWGIPTVSPPEGPLTVSLLRIYGSVRCITVLSQRKGSHYYYVNSFPKMYSFLL